jgi:cell wall-associated NlpC family hydrolase
MSYADAVSRVAGLQALILQASTPTADPARTAASATPTAVATPTASPLVDFSALLAAAGAPTAGSAPTVAAGGSAGMRALAAAESQLGQAESPPGSNDGPAIARYRSAVEGAYAGAPWCAYFVSWAAAQAGAPLGERGQGFGSVAEITDWASRTGRLTMTPQPGDLILFGTRHVGIVESVNADGTLTTVEGNASDAVSRETHSPSEATGFVRL